MKALSIKQPWADLIIRGKKDVENRSWPTSHRGDVLIHAGLTLEHGPWLRHGYGPSHEWEHGGIVGVVAVIDCIQDSKSPWAGEGQWHWVLANPRRVPFVKLKGKLQLFEVAWPPDPSMVEAVHRRDEREFADVDALFARVPPAAEIARVLSLDSLRAIIEELEGEPPLPADPDEARAAFAHRFQRRLNTVLTLLEDDERHALLTAAGLSPRQRLDAWYDALGEPDDDDFADDPPELKSDDDGDDAEPDQPESMSDEVAAGSSSRGSELVKKLGIKREDGWLYYFDDGNIMRTLEGPDGDDLDLSGAEVVIATGVEREEGFIYFLDINGDLARSRERTRSRASPSHTRGTPTVAEILEWLAADCGRNALAALCDARALPRRKSKEEMRGALARSYHGNVASLVAQIRGEDLVSLLASSEGIRIAGRWVRAPNAATTSIDELRAIALAAFTNADTTQLVPSHDDRKNGDVDGLREQLAHYTGRRAIEIRSLLKKVGLGELQRLRTDRFRELVSRVRAAGFDICDVDGRAFGDDDESPGIDAHILVKPRSSTASLAQAAEASTSAVPVTTPTAPIPASTVRGTSGASNYEIAVARLRVLTGAPWPDRHASSFWPHEFIQLACETPLDAGQSRMLSLLGDRLVGGTHDIDAPVSLLRESQERGRLAALVDGFEILNDGIADIAARARALRERLGLE